MIFFQFLTSKIGQYLLLAAGVLAGLFAVRKSGSDAEKAKAVQKVQEDNNAQAKVRADIDATSGSDARKRLQSDWAKH